MFKALLLENTDGFKAPVDESRLLNGDVILAMAYSTLNCKDGLALPNKRLVVRNWPMVAGIDGAGTAAQMPARLASACA